MTIGHNSGAADFDGLVATLEILTDDAKRWEKDTPDAVTASIVRDAIDAALGLNKRADKMREDEKRPHLEAGRAVDARFKPVLDGAERVSKTLKQALQRYIEAEKRRQAEIAEAARKAAEEEARKAREAEEAARKAEADPFDAFDAQKAQEAAAEAARKAEEAQAAAASKVRVGGLESGARALGTRTTYEISVTNPEALVGHFATHPGIVEECRKLALAQVRAGKGFAAIPGIEIIKAERVA